MKVKWSKEIPKEEGFYWIRYRGKYGWCNTTCTVHWVGRGVVVRTDRGDLFLAGPDHGGWDLKSGGKIEKGVRFGPKIEEPD